MIVFLKCAFYLFETKACEGFYFGGDLLLILSEPIGSYW
jgi:hypothetical protein